MGRWVEVDLSEPFRFDRYQSVDEIDDSEWREYPLERVERDGDGWDITFDGSWGTYLPDTMNKRGLVPRVGDMFRTYGRGWGYPDRGRAVAGQVLWYETADEHRERSERERIERDRLKKEEFYKNEYDDFLQRRDALPEVFRERIAVRERNNPDFDWDYGQYELFTCEQAALIADALKTVEAIEAFREQSWDEQKKAVPGLSDGHSGNTFGCACALAMWYLHNPSQVPVLHGALSPLVGSKAYGDVSPDA